MKLEPAHIIFLKTALRHRPLAYLRPSVSGIAILLWHLRTCRQNPF